MRKNPATRLIAGIVVLLLAGGCGTSGSDRPSAGQDHRGGTLHILDQSDFDHLDPARNYPPSQLHLETLYAPTLTSYVNAPGLAGTEVGADAATDTGRPNADATQWSFTLRDNLTWQDGRPVTCADFRYGVNRSFSDLLPGGPTYQKAYLRGGDTYSGIYQDPRGIPSVTCSEQTITYQLKYPVPDFRYAVSMGIFAAVRQDRDTRTKYDDQPFSYGPYMIKTHVRDQSLTLVRNPYWDQGLDHIRKNLPDVLSFTFGLSREVITDRLIQDRDTDQQTIPFANTTVSPEQLSQVLGNPKLRSRTFSGYTGSTSFIAINTRKVPDVRCRQAYSYAMNKQTYVTVLGGPATGDYANTVAGPSMKAYRAAPATDPRGDPAKARQLLAQASDCPRTIKYDYAQTPVSDRTAAAVKDAFARAGITVLPTPIARKEFYSTVGKPGTEDELVNTGFIPDWPSGAALYPPLFDGRQILSDGNSNFSLLDDPKVNQAIRAAEAEPDTRKAQTLWAQVDRLVMESAAIIPLQYVKVVILTGSKVTGARMHSEYFDISLLNVGVTT
ncbi:ABC transporter substrate-binding protein [Fodinicola feengrottensis]|uniref:ABC transporter substrate-binding protein n=1 Tax=Fodinicola feengrottensis TaxID=435914 RepID=A0ABN2G6P6_9ACTN|nr:ABC transporter substrate-binding protein [Fodinicola feengrottensis]